MTDNKTIDNGALTDIPCATAEVTFSGDTVDVQIVALGVVAGAEGARTAALAPGDSTDGILVNLGANNDVTVTGTVTANLAAGTNNIGDVDVLSVPAPLSTAGGGTEATALRVTIASDSTGVVSIDDNGGSITVDGSVSVTGAVDTELPAAAALADDTANPTVPAVGSFVMVYDGATWDRLPGTAADGALVNLGANNDVTVTGTVTANLAAGTNNIGDVDVLTINGQAPAFGTGVRSAATQRVTIATDDVVPASQSGTWNIGTVTTVTGVTTVTTVTTCATVTNLSQLGGQAIAMGTGTRSAGTQRVTIATDDVVPAAQSGTWTVQPGNTANTTPWLVTQTPGTTGGLTTYHLVSAASTNATNIKASAGQVYGWYIYNSNASARKVAFHNSASAPTAGASIFFSLVIPGSSAANVAFPSGIAFSSGIGITTVTDLTDAGATAVAANDLIINIFYK